MARKSEKAHSVQSRKKKNRSEKRSRHLERNVVNDLTPANAFDVSRLPSAQFEGSISRLPNEMMQLILSRLEMQQLIHLQVVCKKWQAAICSIGCSKKSLWLAQFRHDTSYVDNLKKRSFGQIDLSTFANIKFKPNSSEQSHYQLVKFFPNIESIVMDLHLDDILTFLRQWPLNQLTTLSVSDTLVRVYNSYNLQQLRTLINLCVSLKRLDLRIQINSQLSFLAPTLARLEQFSCCGYEPTIFGHFGPNFSRLSIKNFGQDVNFDQWHTINGQWLANLTHLELNYVYELDRLIHYLSEHAVALQGLRIFSHSTRMTSQMIGHLSSLNHLTDIYLNWIIFELSQLEKARRNFELTQLVSIRACTLTIYKLTNFTDSETIKTESAQFASVLSAILPNVEHLNIAINNVSYGTLQGVESYLDRFTKLQTHSFTMLQCYRLSGF